MASSTNPQQLQHLHGSSQLHYTLQATLHNTLSTSLAATTPPWPPTHKHLHLCCCVRCTVESGSGTGCRWPDPLGKCLILSIPFLSPFFIFLFNATQFLQMLKHLYIMEALQEGGSFDPLAVMKLPTPLYISL